jgi:hypothetical protein
VTRANEDANTGVEKCEMRRSNRDTASAVRAVTIRIASLIDLRPWRGKANQGPTAEYGGHGIRVNPALPRISGDANVGACPGRSGRHRLS